MHRRAATIVMTALDVTSLRSVNTFPVGGEDTEAQCRKKLDKMRSGQTCPEKETKDTD